MYLLYQITFNKAILVEYGFPYPIFLTTVQLLIAMLLTQLLARTTNLLPAATEVCTTAPTRIVVVDQATIAAVACMNLRYICYHCMNFIYNCLLIYVD